MFTRPLVLLKPHQVKILVQLSGLIMAVSAVELLCASSVFHLELKHTRYWSRNYSFVLKEFRSYQQWKDEQPGGRKVMPYWYDLIPAVCSAHFLDTWYLVLAFATIFLCIYQLCLAAWGTAVTCVDREKDIMLSLWISRVWEPSLHLLGVYVLVLLGCGSYRSEQSKWLTEVFHSVKLDLHESQRRCSHGSSDAFYGSVIFNVVVLTVLNLFSLVLGFVANQHDPPAAEKGTLAMANLTKGAMLETGASIWSTGKGLEQEPQEETYDMEEDLSTNEDVKMTAQYEESGFFRKRSSLAGDILTQNQVLTFPY